MAWESHSKGGDFFGKSLRRFGTRGKSFKRDMNTLECHEAENQVGRGKEGGGQSCQQNCVWFTKMKKKGGIKAGPGVPGTGFHLGTMRWAHV